MTLEKILQVYFGCEGNVYNEGGELTENGECARRKMCSFLYNFQELTGIPLGNYETIIDNIINDSNF